MPGLGVGIAVGITSGSGSRLPLNGLICRQDYRYGVATRDAGGGNIYVTDWSSQSPAAGPVASNINTAEQPYYGDGTGGIVFDGVNDSLKFTAPLGSHTSHTMYFRISLEAGASKRVLHVQGADAVVVGRNSSRLAVYDGSWHEVQGAIGTDALVDALVEVVLDGDAGTMVVTVDGAAVTLDDATYTPNLLDGAAVLGANYLQNLQFTAMTLWDVLLYSRVLSTLERSNVRTELAA